MQPIIYRSVRSDRRTISIQITADGVLVRAPRRMTEGQIQEFVQSKERWIRTHLQNRPAPMPMLSGEELADLPPVA